jgi:hydrogenase/urease accessory protein HupE
VENEETFSMGTFPYKRCAAAVIAFFFLFLPAAVFAHQFEYGAITTTLTVGGSGVELHSTLPIAIVLYEDHVEEQYALYQEYFSRDLAVSLRGEPCEVTVTSISQPAVAKTLFEGSYRCLHPITTLDDLTIHNALFSGYFQNYDNYLTLIAGEERRELLFTPTIQEYPADFPGAAGTHEDNLLAVAKRFIVLGMEHIWIGYDHLLFLLSVILLSRSLKNILVLVTSFTLAHSVTLILAGLGIVEISPRIVEPAIAATIAYLAVRNALALRTGDTDSHTSERWATTFGFGLIHGLGFATALAETGIPENYFVSSLLIFNVGIEIGQLAVLAIAVPLLFLIDRFPYRRAVLLSVSGVTFLVATVWFVSRIIG